MLHLRVGMESIFVDTISWKNRELGLVGIKFVPNS